MENLLNDEELNELANALCKPRNEAQVTVGLCNLIFVEASTAITVVQSRGPNSPVKGKYNQVRELLIDCITKYVNTIKRVPGPYYGDETTYNNFLETVSLLEDSIKGALSVNPKVIIISNLWYSLKPTIVALVNLLSGRN